MKGFIITHLGALLLVAASLSGATTEEEWNYRLRRLAPLGKLIVAADLKMLSDWASGKPDDND